LKKLQEELIIHNIDNNYIGDVVIVEGKLHTELKGEITKSLLVVLMMLNLLPMMMIISMLAFYWAQLDALELV
jgi:hypothetical protein